MHILDLFHNSINQKKEPNISVWVFIHGLSMRVDFP